MSLRKMHFASELGFSDGLEGRVLSGLASCNCILQRREGQLRLAAKVQLTDSASVGSVGSSVVRAGNHWSRSWGSICQIEVTARKGRKGFKLFTPAWFAIFKRYPHLKGKVL